MPNFIELFFAPWKIFNFFGGIKPPAAAVVDPAFASPLPQDALCGFRDLGGGQMVSICHVFGYDMPSFIFWASTAIFILFLFSSLVLFKQCNDVARGMAHLARQFEKLPRPKDDTLTDSHLSTIRVLMEKEKITARLWDGFEESLLKSPEGDEIYSTQPIDAYFSKAALIDDNVHGALFNAIPGVLTGVGLLMTFVAILDGLSHVTVAANMDVRGIGGLINGLSGKFISSIVAVSCAVAFVFVERFAYSRPEAAYRNMISRLTQRFRRRSMEHLLYQLVLQSPRGHRSSRSG